MSRILTRHEWGAPPAAFDRIGPVSTVFIHHTVTDAHQPLTPAMQQLEAHARALGHRAIDYSFAHFIDGQRAEGRGWWAAGGHTLNWNSKSYGLVGVGDFRTDPVTDLIISGFADTIREGIALGAITKNPDIRPHSDVFATACPARLKDAIPRIRSLVSSPVPPSSQSEADMCFTLDGKTYYWYSPTKPAGARFQKTKAGEHAPAANKIVQATYDWLNS